MGSFFNSVTTDYLSAISLFGFRNTNFALGVFY